MPKPALRSKVEARGNAPVLKVGLGVVEQVPARDHRHNGDDLEQPRTHTWIAEAEPLLVRRFDFA
jgi:hypothetical protein